MNTPKYLVAKYIPDLWRMEPRNIGVVVQSQHGIAARFVGEKADDPGSVDGRSIPSFIHAGSAYRQWIKYWQHEVRNENERIFTTPDISAIDSEKFLDSLAESGHGNYILAGGGQLLDDVGTSDLYDLVEYLYRFLVEGDNYDDSSDLTLDKVCDQVISEARLREDPHFHVKYPVECSLVGPASEQFVFSYAYANGSLQRLYQQVPISRQRTTLRKTVHDSAWMFDKVVTSGVIRPDQGVALVRVSADLKGDSNVNSLLRVLRSVTNVLDVADPDTLRKEFGALRAGEL